MVWMNADLRLLWCDVSVTKVAGGIPECSVVVAA